MPVTYLVQTVSKLLASFRYAGRGVVTCLRREQNFRIHITAVFYSITLGFVMPLTCGEWAVLLLTQALVLSLELVNTAVEAAVDLASPESHPLAEIAKDTAAGAVLVAALASVGIGCFLFLRPQLIFFIGKILTTPWLFLLSAATVGGFTWFIFGFKEKDKINEI